MSEDNNKPVISYGNRPSFASLVDLKRNQFVLLKTRTGGLVHPHIAEEVLNDADQLEEKINLERQNTLARQFVCLRGVWFDDAHGGVTLFVQLLHDHGEKPALTEQDIRDYFHDDHTWYQGQMVSVEVSIRPVNTYSDYFWPVLDEYYDWVEDSDLFGTGIIEAILARMGNDAVSILHTQLAKKSTSLAEKLPKEINSVEDVVKVREVIKKEQSELSNEQSNSLTIDFVETTYQSLNSNRQERLRQAKISFNTALLLAVVGVVVIICGVVLLYFGNISAGTVTTIGGLIPEVISLLLLRINNETNNRLDQITEQLNVIDKARVAIRFVEKIKDSATRDTAIASIVENLRNG